MPVLVRLAVWVLAGVLVAPVEAQTQVPGPASTRLRVFLDCEDCFQEYLRTEIRWVDFVRRPEEADVHLLSSSTETGGGGREVLLRFVGAGRFQDVDHALRAISLSADSEDSRRRNVLRTVLAGLVAYAARHGLPLEMTLSVRADAPDGTAVDRRDPWNAWVFGLTADASLDAEESRRDSTWELGVTADRVTEAWKVSFGVSADQTTNRFDLDEDEPRAVTRREREFDAFLARSLGEHWSYGARGSVISSTFGNVKFSTQASPIVEFSVFPYRQYATRQLLLQYGVGFERTEYNEITLFDKTRETLGRHEASIRLDQRAPWGTLEGSVEWSQYLHEARRHRLEVDGEVSLRVARGLSLDVEASASRIRDQLSLPRRGATPEEVLLRLRELRSGYEVELSIGIRYTFGSLFNNVVNPRFGD